MVWANDSLGNELLDVVTGAPSDGFDAPPLTGALVIVTGPPGFLLVHDVWRDQWELAGGGIESGESADEAARREVTEESGQRLTHCRHLGTATFRRARDGALERADIFWGRVDHVAPFDANDEVDAIRWWDGRTSPDQQIGAIDAALHTWALVNGVSTESSTWSGQ